MATRHRDMSRFVTMNARNDAAQRGLRGDRPEAAAQCPQQQTHPSIHGCDPCAVRRRVAARQPHEESSHRGGQPGVVWGGGRAARIRCSSVWCSISSRAMRASAARISRCRPPEPAIWSIASAADSSPQRRTGRSSASASACAGLRRRRGRAPSWLANCRRPKHTGPASDRGSAPRHASSRSSGSGWPAARGVESGIACA